MVSFQVPFTKMMPDLADALAQVILELEAAQRDPARRCVEYAQALIGLREALMWSRHRDPL